MDFEDRIAFQAYEHWSDKVNTGFFRTIEDEKRWCWNQYLQPKNLREVKMTIEEIWQSLERFNIRRFQLPNRVDRSNFNVKDDNYLVLKICIFGAFFPNYFGKLIFLVMFEICCLLLPVQLYPFFSSESWAKWSKSSSEKCWLPRSLKIIVFHGNYSRYHELNLSLTLIGFGYQSWFYFISLQNSPSLEIFTKIKWKTCSSKLQ